MTTPKNIPLSSTDIINSKIFS